MVGELALGVLSRHVYFRISVCTLSAELQPLPTGVEVEQVSIQRGSRNCGNRLPHLTCSVVISRSPSLLLPLVHSPPPLHPRPLLSLLAHHSSHLTCSVVISCSPSLLLPLVPSPPPPTPTSLTPRTSLLAPRTSTLTPHTSPAAL